MNSKQFLIFGGAILVVVGVLGMVGLIGPTADKSVFGANWWFDRGENWAHLILGVVGLLAAFTFPPMAQKWLVMLLGVIGIAVGVYSIFQQKFLGSNLENPADTILHVAVGAWALFCAFMTKKMGSSMGASSMPSTPSMPNTGM